MRGKHMLSNGQNKCFKKSHLVCIVIIILIVLIVLIALTSFIVTLVSNYLYETSIYNNKYYNDIRALLETSNTFTLDEIVDFEFDKVYVAAITEVYLGKDHFLEELNINSTVDIPTMSAGNHNRLLFIKDNVIIYDLVYPLYEIYFDDEVIWIYPGESIKVISKTDKQIMLGLE